ncbi:MAG: glycosyltransferase [Saprospiraceae bacterium]|nr:glycosyltransferase [Saprospiraceae bacterium]
MRLLLVLVQYRPAMNPNVYRWAGIAEHWVASGHEIHLLCARHSERPDEEVVNGVQVHRAGQATLLDWAYNLTGAKQRRSEPGLLPARPGLLRRVAEKIIDISWRKLYWPDGSCGWYFPARRRALSLLSAQRFDAVISVGLPFTAHLVGMACKKRFPLLRFVMDVEDPFCFSEEFFVNNAALYRRLNYKAEHAAFRAADAVALTNPAAAARYAALFPAFAEKLCVIPPLYNLPPPVRSFPMRDRRPGEIRLGYFGSFYRKVRTPERFLRLMRALCEQRPAWRERLRVHFFGSMEAEFVQLFQQFPELRGCLFFHGLISREDTASAMQEMDALLHIGNTTDYHLPSKSVDYLAAGKPVLNIAACEADAFQKFAQGFSQVLHLYWPGGVPPEEAITALEGFWGNYRESPADLPERIRPFRVERIAAGYEDALKR